MRKFFLFAFTLLFLSACSTETDQSVDELNLSVSDFTPPDYAERGHPTDGPYEQRLLSATSKDGIVWEKTNELITEQASASDMAYKDGVIYLYYVGGNFDGREQGIAAAVSQDNGETWTFKRVMINEADEIKGEPGDPDIIILDDNSFRLYFTSQTPNRKSPSIFYAESSDGLNFTYKGEALYDDDYMTIDSSVFRINEEWFMLTFTDFATEVIHAKSDDEGKTFQVVKKENVTYKNKPWFLSNPLELPDGSVRFYAFNLRDGFRSFVTTDGLNWEDQGYGILTYDPSNPMERDYIKDASLVQLDDGSYFMAYGTRIPE